MYFNFFINCKRLTLKLPYCKTSTYININYFVINTFGFDII